MYKNLKVTAILPALNEEKVVGSVVRQLFALHSDQGNIIDQVVVCDNGSTDQTKAVATQAGADVVQEKRKGYGAACKTATLCAGQTDVFLFLNADGAERVDEAVNLLDSLTEGADLVIGSRTLGDMERGALLPQQRLGNGLAALLIAFFWQQKVTDLGPFRAIRVPVFNALDMQDQDFGWTVEMQIKAIKLGYRISEVPVSALKTQGPSKISGTLRGCIGAAWKIISTIVFAGVQELCKRPTQTLVSSQFQNNPGPSKQTK